MIKLLKNNDFLVKGKQTSHTGNYHLNQKQQNKNTFSSYLLSFSHASFVFSLLYCDVCGYLTDILSNTSSPTFWFFLSMFFYCDFIPFSNVFYAQDDYTKHLSILSFLKFLNTSFGWCNLLPIKMIYSNSVLKFLFLKRCNFQPIKLQLRWQKFPEIPLGFSLAFSKI